MQINLSSRKNIKYTYLHLLKCQIWSWLFVFTHPSWKLKWFFFTFCSVSVSLTAFLTSVNILLFDFFSRTTANFLGYCRFKCVWGYGGATKKGGGVGKGVSKHPRIVKIQVSSKHDTWEYGGATIIVQIFT